MAFFGILRKGILRESFRNWNVRHFHEEHFHKEKGGYVWKYVSRPHRRLPVEGTESRSQYPERHDCCDATNITNVTDAGIIRCLKTGFFVRTCSHVHCCKENYKIQNFHVAQLVETLYCTLSKQHHTTTTRRSCVTPNTYPYQEDWWE